MDALAQRTTSAPQRTPRLPAMNILIVLFVIQSHMAAVARSAPVPASGAPDAAAAPPAAPELSSSLDDTLSVIKKVQIGVQEAHRAHITAENLVLNSDKGQFSVMAENIGLPVFPVLHVTPENATMSLQETTVVQMLQGVLLHETLLGLVAPHLRPTDALTELLVDTGDLLRHLCKLLRAMRAKREAATAVGTTTTLTKELEEVAPVLKLRLTRELHIQVAMHLALQGLQDFSQDMERILRPLVQANDEDMAEAPGPM